MGTVYLLRHGETAYHAERRLLGRIDAGLNERGWEQARRVVDFFADINLAAIYSSPLTRCRETGSPLADAGGIKIEVAPGLMEVDMGEWDGRSIAELFKDESELVGRWMGSPSTVPIPGGEDFGAVKKRVMEAIRGITSRYTGDEDILVVSHGGPIRGILCEALKMDMDDMFRIQIDLASISSIKFFDGGIPDTAVVTLVNETGHLK